MDHLDEEGRPCTRHAPARLDALLALACVGSRAAGFQHDAASKLQSLVMALEEIGERVDVLGDTQLVVAVEAARTAVSELTSQLQAFRALTRPAVATAIPLRALLARAAERASVQVRGEIPAVELAVAIAEVSHVTALLLDAAVGASRRREVDVVCGARSFAIPAGATSEVIAIAAAAYRRSGGELRCTATSLVVTW